MKTITKEINKDEELKRKIKEAREKGTIMPIISDNCFKVMFANQAHLETLTFLISKVLGIWNGL